MSTKILTEICASLALAAPALAQSTDLGWGLQLLPHSWPPSLGVGLPPRSLASADLDLDGIVDILFDGGLAPGSRVALGRPNGSFGTPQSLPGLPGSWLIVYADLDLDGHVDAVRRPFTAGGIFVHMGMGGGSFGPGQALSMSPTGTEDVAALVLGDLDSDGAMDLVTCDATARLVSVRRGTGGGQFGPLGVTQLGGFPGRLAAADVNGDGALDLLAEGAVQSGRFGLLIGDGTGGFLAPLPLTVFANPSVLRDVDSDGVLDLVVATPGSPSGSIRVFRGDGLGGFSLLSTTAWSAPLREIALGDFDGDSFPDAAVIDSAGAVVVFDGNGDGTFGLPRRLGIAPSLGLLLAVDLDADGIDDLLASGANGVAVLYGTHLWGLSDGREWALSGELRSLDTADLVIDGHPDLLVARTAGSGWTVELLAGDGHGQLSSSSAIGVPFDPDLSALGDIDGDGRVDAVFGSSSGSGIAWVRVGLGGVLLAPQILMPGLVLSELICADFNHDGFEDIVALDGAGLNLQVLAGGIAPPSGVTTIALPARAVALGSGDIDGDGWLDLVAATDAPSLCWLRGSGPGLGSPATFPLQYTPNSIDVGRIDGDALDDVAFGTSEVGPVVRLGSAAGPAVELIPAPTLSASGIEVADADGDGRADLIFDVEFPTATVVAALRGNALGFESPNAWAMTQVPGLRSLADLDGDGALELLQAEPSAAGVRSSNRRKGPRYDSYCPAGTSVAGCVQDLIGLGVPSASAGGGPVLATLGVDGQRTALTFWSTDRPSIKVWAPGSTSTMCLGGRLRRSPAQFSFGSLGACDGSISFDANAAFVGNGIAPGHVVYAQTWVRDPAAPKGSQLSNGLAFAVEP